MCLALVTWKYYKKENFGNTSSWVIQQQFKRQPLTDSHKTVDALIVPNILEKYQLKHSFLIWLSWYNYNKHENVWNISSFCRRIVWVCLTIMWVGD